MVLSSILHNICIISEKTHEKHMENLLVSSGIYLWYFHVESVIIIKKKEEVRR
jgi:hypothetical protein